MVYLIFTCLYITFFNDCTTVSQQLSYLMRLNSIDFITAKLTRDEFIYYSLCEEFIQNTSHINSYNSFVKNTLPTYSNDQLTATIRADIAQSLEVDLDSDTLFSFEEIFQRLGLHGWDLFFKDMAFLIEDFPASKSSQAVSIILHDVTHQLIEEIQRQPLDLRAEFMRRKVFLEAPRPEELENCPQRIPITHPIFWASIYFLNSLHKLAVLQSCTLKRNTMQTETENFMCPKLGKVTSEGFEPSIANFTPLLFKNQALYTKYGEKYLKIENKMNKQIRTNRDKFYRTPNVTVEEEYVTLKQVLLWNLPYASLSDLNSKGYELVHLVEKTRIKTEGAKLLPNSKKNIYENKISMLGFQLRQNLVNSGNNYRRMMIASNKLPRIWRK